MPLETSNHNATHSDIPKYNIFKKKNKYKDIITETEYLNINIINDFSINDEKNYFTNFLSQNGDLKKKQALKYLCDKLLIENECVDKHFINNEIQYSIQTTKRLIEIFKCNGIILSEKDITKVIKFKSRFDAEIQFYMRLNKNTLEIILIDVYHLGIPSEIHWVNRKPIASNPQRQYKKHKKKNYCISSIIREYQIQ